MGQGEWVLGGGGVMISRMTMYLISNKLVVLGYWPLGMVGVGLDVN